MRGIYCIRHIESGKVYVGAGNIKRRIRSHFKGIGRCSAIRDAIKEHGSDAFDWEVLEICSQENLKDRECHYIASLDCLVPNGFNLMFGGKHHKTTRQKKSEAWKGEGNPYYGKNLSAEHRRKIAEAQKGKNNHFYGNKHSDETRRKMSGENNHFHGKKHSDESLRKMSETSRHPCWEHADEICRRFIEGESQSSIARAFGCESRTPIRRILKSRYLTQDTVSVVT